MNERWQRMKSVYGGVMDLTSRGRRAYLEALSAPSLRSAVQRLLDAGEHSGSFMERAALDHLSLVPETLTRKHRVLLDGEVLADRFEVVSLLGSGGMGEVYRVWDREMRSACALKTLRSELSDQPTLASRLRKEVQLARLVTHRNVCRLYEMGRARSAGGDDVAYFTMELLEGKKLSDLVRGKPMSHDGALPLAFQLLEGLEAAHAQKVVHRDLKSANVFVEDGRLVITDFGLAFQTAASFEETYSAFGQNATVGTPAYMAPEQVRGEAVTCATDLYAVGVIFFEMLTGRLPFEGDTPIAVALKRLQEPPPDLARVLPGAPVHWCNAVNACLRQDAAARPGSVAELRLILEGKAKPRRVVSRRKVIAASGSLLVAAGAASWLVGARNGTNPEARSHFELATEFARRRTKEDLTEAIREYRAALQADPQHLESWTGLVDAYTAMAGFNFMPSREGLDRAREAANRAVAIAPRSGKALGALGWTLSVDVLRWREAEPYLQRAVDFDPASPVLRRWYGGHLGKLGRFSEAIAQMKEGLRLEPPSLPLRHGLAAEYFRARRFREFYEQCLELVRIQPLEASSHHALARASEWRGDYDKAIECCDTADRLRNTPVSRCIRGCVEALRGRFEPAWRIAGEIDDLWRKQEFESSLLAGLWMRLGETSRAMTTLHAGFDRADSTVITALTSPYFNDLAEHRSFSELKRRLRA